MWNFLYFLSNMKMNTEPSKVTVVMIMVMSTNGIVAQKTIEDSFEWSSKEDRMQFLDKIRNIGTALMGANTYRSIGSQPYKGVDFYVLTRHPEQFEHHERVTFVEGDVEDIYKLWETRGLTRVALLGGPSTNRLFLDKELVNEIFLTIEPAIMPEGLHLVTGLDRQVNLKLLSLNTLNEQNTLLLHYSVVKNKNHQK